MFLALNRLTGFSHVRSAFAKNDLIKDFKSIFHLQYHTYEVSSCVICGITYRYKTPTLSGFILLMTLNTFMNVLFINLIMSDADLKPSCGKTQP